VVAAGAVAGGIEGLFDGLAPTEVIEAYDRLLATGGRAKDRAESVVGDAEMVRALTERGMAHIQPHSPTAPAWLHPAPRTWPCRGCSPVTSTGLPATRRCCWTGLAVWPMLRPGSAPR
jgi:hypothetical protein